MTIAALGSAIYVWNSNSHRLPVVLESPSKITAPLSPISEKLEKSSQTSPDGTKRLVMTKMTNAGGGITYIFETEDSLGLGKTEIYRDSNATDTYDLPFNAWSPDNKYVFLYKNSKNALVFRADGNPIIEGEAYLDLEEIYKAKKYTNSIKEATGWADPSLVIFNTLDKNGNTASFWLEVPSKAIIPLATQF